MIGPACGRCGYIHTRPQAVGRFTRPGVLWQGCDDGPLRDTREAAERDLCDRNKRRADDTREG